MLFYFFEIYLFVIIFAVKQKKIKLIMLKFYKNRVKLSIFLELTEIILFWYTKLVI